MTTKLDRALGCFLGLAIGDAVGSTTEFTRREEHDVADRVTDMVGGGCFNLPAGYWTDDTSMALCIADSIIRTGRIDPKDQMDLYLEWFKNGYNSPTGHCFDIGTTCINALKKYNTTGNPIAGCRKKTSSGNGAIMRLAPVSIWTHAMPLVMSNNMAVTSTITTHGSDICVECSYLLNSILHSMINHPGLSKDDHVLMFKDADVVRTDVSSVANGDYLNKSYNQVGSRGYATASLEFALWCFVKTDNFKDCILICANGCGDADTNCAIAGQIAGAYYGIDGIPEDWIAKVAWSNHIIDTTKLLFELGENQ